MNASADLDSPGPDSNAGAFEPAQPHLHLASCWACDTRVQVPLQGGQPVLVFKCGFCGALTTPPPAGKAPHRPSERRRNRERARVGGVVVLILTLISLGMCFVLPLTPALWVHLPLTAWLSFAVLFNYYAAVTRDPVSKTDLLSGTGVVRCKLDEYRPVQQGSMEGFSYCAACDAPKPPDAHHCSTCGACINGMDHHCPFIGSCVGAGNRRWFLVLLYWTLAACFYIAILMVLTMRRQQDVVAVCWSAFKREYQWSRALLTLWWIAKVSPPWLVATMYLLSASTGVIIAAGMLFQQQLIWVVTGISYVDALKMQRAPAGSILMQRRALRERLQDIFGDDPPWMWLLPSWSPAPHSRACKKGC